MKCILSFLLLLFLCNATLAKTVCVQPISNTLKHQLWILKDGARSYEKFPYGALTIATETCRPATVVQARVSRKVVVCFSNRILRKSLQGLIVVWWAGEPQPRIEAVKAGVVDTVRCWNAYWSNDNSLPTLPRP